MGAAGALTTSLLGAGVGAAMVYVNPAATSGQVAAAAGCSALVAFMIQAALLSVLFSSVATLYVLLPKVAT